ncbi:hypothetical protein [Vreelandella titanicae]|uniref:hypothetical protein n=1 Tax=Vreelandella titanicae TaxID=664683 RepID=UPI00242020C4|nr:hypothetical protein [Halomonas titanicae]
MHQLLAHPLFEERPASDILEPFGFDVNVRSTELPNEDDEPEDFARFTENYEAYIEALEHTPPGGFTEIARFETEDGDIVFVSVRAKTFFAQRLLGSDPDYSELVNPQARAGQAIYEERTRQMQMEDFSRERDDHYMKGELARAAGAYASVAGNAIERGASDTSNMLTTDWPFDCAWWKPTTPRRDLVKAGALILAEIERQDRAAAYAKAGEDAA